MRVLSTVPGIKSSIPPRLHFSLFGNSESRMILCYVLFLPPLSPAPRNCSVRSIFFLNSQPSSRAYAVLQTMEATKPDFCAFCKRRAGNFPSEGITVLSSADTDVFDWRRKDRRCGTVVPLAAMMMDEKAIKADPSDGSNAPTNGIDASAQHFLSIIDKGILPNVARLA